MLTKVLDVVVAIVGKLLILAVCVLPIYGAYYMHEQKLIALELAAFADPLSEPAAAPTVAPEDAPAKVAETPREPSVTETPLYVVQRVNVLADLNAPIHNIALRESVELPPVTVEAPKAHKKPPMVRVAQVVATVTPAQKPTGPMDDERWKTISKREKYNHVEMFLRRVGWVCPEPAQTKGMNKAQARAWGEDQLQAHNWSVIRNLGFSNCVDARSPRGLAMLQEQKQH